MGYNGNGIYKWIVLKFEKPMTWRFSGLFLPGHELLFAQQELIRSSQKWWKKLKVAKEKKSLRSQKK